LSENFELSPTSDTEPPVDTNQYSPTVETAYTDNYQGSMILEHDSADTEHDYNSSSSRQSDRAYEPNASSCSSSESEDEENNQGNEYKG